MSSSTASSMDVTVLSQREIEIVIFAMQCYKGDPKIDHVKLAQIAGLANTKSAQDTMWRIRKKLNLNNTFAAKGSPGKASTAKGSPAKTNGKKRKATAKEEESKEESDNEESKAGIKAEKTATDENTIVVATPEDAAEGNDNEEKPEASPKKRARKE